MKLKNNQLDRIRRFWDWLKASTACRRFGYPGRYIRVIGITGTSGKTTCCHILAAIMRHCGRRVGLITTAGFDIDGKNMADLKTLDNPWIIQRLLREMINHGCQEAIIEVDSIGLDRRHFHGIPFYAAVFLNLMPNHLSYHQTMDSYRRAMLKLFANRPFLTVVNNDDPSADYFLSCAANKTITFGQSSRADIMAKKVYPKSRAIDFVLLINSGQAAVSLPLPGAFNVTNALAAIATAIGLDFKIDKIIEAIGAVQAIPGRMEVVEAGQPFTIIIDYAKTADALAKILENIRPTVRGRLIAVISAPNHKIPYKYKESGEGKWWWRIANRHEAIEFACRIAKAQDVLVITGRDTQENTKSDNDYKARSDRAITEEIVANLYQINEHIGN